MLRWKEMGVSIGRTEGMGKWGYLKGGKLEEIGSQLGEKIFTIIIVAVERRFALTGGLIGLSTGWAWNEDRKCGAGKWAASIGQCHRNLHDYAVSFQTPPDILALSSMLH